MSKPFCNLPFFQFWPGKNGSSTHNYTYFKGKFMNHPKTYNLQSENSYNYSDLQKVGKKIGIRSLECHSVQSCIVPFRHLLVKLLVNSQVLKKILYIMYIFANM